MVNNSHGYWLAGFPPRERLQLGRAKRTFIVFVKHFALLSCPINHARSRVVGGQHPSLDALVQERQLHP